MNDMQDKFREYARLLIDVGVDVAEGQDLVISCPVDCAWFARLCASAAYDAGCREVVMRWDDDALSRMKYLRAADDVFDDFPRWRADMMTGCAKRGAAFLHIDSDDPENLKGVDAKRIARAQRSAEEPLREYRRMQMANEVAWSIGAVPSPAWAEKVFPGVPAREAEARLWDAILETVRVTGDGGAAARWRDHTQTLQKRVDILNSLDLVQLRYVNSLGTDLTVRLPEDRVWAGGAGLTAAGRPFVPNMPTEEIFTAPRLDGVDGVVYASRPLAYQGNIVDKFRFTVRGGRIVEVRAQTGEDILKEAVSLDEGASRFGEVALVPYDSPISRQGILYYNTLFDENAACHLAFGEAYPECVAGGEKMSRSELKAHGLNDSLTHVDFMVGTPDLNILGTARDGREIPVFTNGNFAF